MKKAIVIAALALSAYFLWRKFGGDVKGVISSVTA